jgi:serine/threonine protein kinase
MKTIKKSFVKEENVVHQISREIRIHLSLKHLNIIGFYGFFDDAENVYLLIEYATGG